MKESREAGTSDAGSSKPQTDGILNDPRFAHLVSDPRFKNIHKSTRSVKIDNRFKSMFKDDHFKVKYTSDKYGRRVNKTSTEDLEKYYDLSSEEDEDDEKRKEEAKLVKEATGANDELQSDEEISGDVKDKLKDLKVDYARGEAALWSDSSSDDELSEDEGKEMFIEHVWGELDNDAPRTDESTRRLAACNMDWDRMRAPDIMVLCNSFLPPGGSILSVAIYPSEYGKERMAEEEVRGPQELIESSEANKQAELSDSDNDSILADSEADSDKEEGDDYHMEKLRQYQLNRLKYYYAVIECNSIRAADKLYQECDGLEYESTATKLDLRFIPDDMTFDDEPKEICTQLPDLTKFQPRLFTTTALQQAKVELTWDENDVDRKELTEKMSSGKLDGISDADLRKYVAYSSEEDAEDVQVFAKRSNTELKAKRKSKKATKAVASDAESDEEPRKGNIISIYKDLLKDINTKESEKKKNRIEMEFSWGIGSVKDNSAAKPDTEINKANTEDLTPFEKIIEKKRAKKKARKVEIKKLKKAQRKGSDASDDSESEDDLPEGVDLNDPYFAEEFATGDFAESKKSSKQKKNKLRKKMKASDEESDGQKETELALLLNDDDNRAHFSLKKIQENENDSKSRKRKKLLKAKKNGSEMSKEPEDDFKINLNDDRFAAIYSSHLYNIDPTDSHFKKTKAMDTLIHEKLKRKPNEFVETDSTSEQPDLKKPKKDVALNMLVKNLKRRIK